MKTIISQNLVKKSPKKNKFDSYFSIGHDWFDDPSKNSERCAYIWIMTNDGNFICEQESDEVRHHNDLINKTIIIHEYVTYKGRIDTCKKAASIASCGACFSNQFADFRIDRTSISEEECKGLYNMSVENIKNRFGNDISIHKFR